MGTKAPQETGMARVLRWEDRTAWPLFAASLLIVGLVSLEWFDGHLDQGLLVLSQVALIGLWAWFIVDFLIRLRLSRGDRKTFIKTRVFDLVSLAIPLLRPFLIIIYIWRLPMWRRGSARMQRYRYIISTVLFAFLYVYVFSSIVWVFERKATGATIVNFGDALWWGFETISTVGYGDYTPVTVLGRIFAVGLMAGGVVVVGMVTATLLSALNDVIGRASETPLPGVQPTEGADGG